VISQYTMSQTAHTYGPTCHLARNVTFSGSKGGDDMPDLKAQFFYSSPLPIDDPLSAVTAPNSSDSKSAKHPPRPFSAYDNNTLEEAWWGLASAKDKKHHKKSKISQLVGKGRDDRVASIASSDSRNGKFGKKHMLNPYSNASSSTAKTKPALGIQDSAPGRETKYGQGPGMTTSPVATNSTPAISGLDKSHTRLKAAKVSSVYDSPAHSGSDVSAPKADCGCKLSHDNCRNSPNSCLCASCPRVSTVTKAKALAPLSEPTDGNSDLKPSEKEDKSSDAPEDSEDGVYESHGGNPYNPNCDDAHHVLLDQTPSCCTDLEVDVPAEHANCLVDRRVSGSHDIQSQDMDSKRRKHDKDQAKGKQDREVGQEQGDAADERYCKKMVQDPDEPSSEEHKAFERHMRSKGHQDFERHLDEERGRNHSQSPSPKVEALKHKLSERKGRSHVPESSSSKQKPSKTYETAGSTTMPSDSVSTNLPVQGGDAGTTGFPFLKFPSRKGSPQPRSPQPSAHDNEENQKPTDCQATSHPENARKVHGRESTETETLHVQGCNAQRNTKEHADVPVGISRLHLVNLPALQMRPIYWSPVHDIAAVTRGTWFYKDTMLPVEPAIANQLEKGYKELRPWSQTWNDELNSAIEVGAAGEEKISHRLWPKDEDAKDRSASKTEHTMSTDPYCAARCFHGEVAAEGTVDPEASDKKPADKKPADTTQTIAKKYSNSQVIYKDSQNAFILKPNLQPSAYYGRKPLQKIKKGTSVGIHVVRGFDWKTWEKLHPSRKTNITTKAAENAPVAGDADASKSNACAACRSQEERPRVTDLILVVHGIGQKLSERVESFHFTHAINDFRRSVNVQISNEGVQRVLRKDLGGVMVLPVNWRSNLSFEDGGPMKDGDQENSDSCFSLKEITPESLPAVRNMISDVMLDIPFYMSQHKPKMIQAVISEANRVYRLWCKNNPEFQKDGRVHIIAHSLGSAMAVEVLSKQPTSVQRIDIHNKKMNTKYFDFNTTNLFFVGSPAGFFLLLDKGKLIPRRGQNKPGAEHGDDHDKSITGDAGTLGCLAVDNVYNVMHQNDPIAYCLNATVDPQYAASLKNAKVPSSSTGFFESIGNAMKSITPGVSSSSDLAVGQVAKPAGVARLPSQLEMEVHDFTREEITEKKFYLLNDNGQVDWCLGSGGGPLEIQYINMLGAHSSYWGSADFVRMVVTEVGKTPGRNHALPNMKAVKMGHKS
jgi:hypothetical protein